MGELVAIAVLVGALVVFVVVHSRRVDAKELRRRRDRELELLAQYLVVLEEHETTLRLRVKQATYFDAYGRPILDKAYKELSYFFESVLVREIEPRSRVEYDLLFRTFNNWVTSLQVETLAPLPASTEAGDGQGYEREVASLMTRLGFDVRFTSVTGDQGVDLIAEREGLRLAIQCKNYSKPVGNNAVQQVFAGAQFYQAGAAAVVAPNGYTVAARQLASSLGVRCLHHAELERVFSPGASLEGVQ